MKYVNIKNDLFRLPSDYYLAHCISSDFAMGAGIAVLFTQRGIKTYLKSNYPRKWENQGYALFAPLPNFKGAYNLVTKQRYYMKPTYKTLQDALLDMKSQLPNDCKLAMPCIGSGLDRLDWQKVEKIIKETFADTDISITVCHL